MSHSLVLALFDTPARATAAARALRGLGVSHERVSIVARNHDEEDALARASGASPGSEIEDSSLASRLGELSAHFLSAVALVMPGIGPIVADGPLAAELAEAAGHAAGSIARSLRKGGLDERAAEEWESHIQSGAIAVGAHVEADGVAAVRDALSDAGALRVAELDWE
jgi:hypothetical protein